MTSVLTGEAMGVEKAVEAPSATVINRGYGDTPRPAAAPTAIGATSTAVPIAVPISVLAQLAGELTVRVRVDSEPIADLPLQVVLASRTDDELWPAQRRPQRR